ncbi:hypothetical protein BDR03DRAFT_1045657 [Suillus americanus]|nr:hypothetical protein BDR03DRAFT_1045657 [Suillus americanus]
MTSLLVFSNTKVGDKCLSNLNEDRGGVPLFLCWECIKTRRRSLDGKWMRKCYQAEALDKTGNCLHCFRLVVVVALLGSQIPTTLPCTTARGSAPSMHYHREILHLQSWFEGLCILQEQEKPTLKESKTALHTYLPGKHVMPNATYNRVKALYRLLIHGFMSVAKSVLDLEVNHKSEMTQCMRHNIGTGVPSIQEVVH